MADNSRVKVSLDNVKHRDLRLSSTQELLDDMSTEKSASTNNEVRFERRRRVGHVFSWWWGKSNERIVERERGESNPVPFLAMGSTRGGCMARQDSYVSQVGLM